MTLGPQPHDPLFQTFWEGTAQGELRVQRCSSCGAWRWPPRPICANCGSFESIWEPVATSGSLVSWTRVEHQTHPDIKPPYVVVIVELEEPAGIRFLGQLRADKDRNLVPGESMRACFEPVEGGSYALVNWAPHEIRRPSDEHTDAN